MSSIDRANLMDDAFALAKAGYINYEIPLQLISYFKVGQEKDWAPWETLNKYFSRLKDLLYSSEEASRDLKVSPIWRIRNPLFPNQTMFLFSQCLYV